MKKFADANRKNPNFDLKAADVLTKVKQFME